MRPQIKPEVAGLVALAYVPFLLSSPGRVSADSNQGLYLDPGGVVTGALDLWDPHVGAGGVPHQRLGYLFPTGPWFWILDQVGMPDWVAQRLWWGTITLAAALGVRWLLRLLGLSGAAAMAGAVVYALSPYQLAFTARMSVLLLPWAALPWLVGLTMQATRARGWRPAAWFAVALLLAGGTNASSLAFVMLGPVLWLGLELTGGRRPTARVLAAGGRLALLGLGVSLWWLVGLRIQGRYGLPVLQLTENVQTVAQVSSPTEVLRGLGNWFFYGRDRVGYSLDQAADYARRDALVTVVTLLLPAVALAVAPLIRWLHLRYFALLVAMGTIVAVGSWPPDDPTVYGSLWTSFSDSSAVGLALRNTPRAVPLVLLGVAGIVAAAVSALPRRPWQAAGAAAVAVIAAAGLLPVLQHGYLSDGLQRPEELPAHWTEASAALDRDDSGTRVLEVPGVSFAAYEWGTTVDPVTPFLIERPYLAREVLPQGGAGTANLLDALDRRMQHGTLEAESLAPIARLLAAGTIVLRGDLEQRGRFDTPDPGALWRSLQAAPGLHEPVGFGGSDDHSTEAEPPPVALFSVDRARAIARTSPASRPVVLAGDGDGIVDAAAAGLIDGRALVLQSGALDDAALQRALDHGAHLVITDSNRRRSQTWFYALRDTRGPTERSGVDAPDPTGYDFRLDPFPGRGDRFRTVVDQVGGQATATAEGGPERPEDRAAHAIDGDPATAWRVAGPTPEGAVLTITPERPVAASEVRLVQPAGAAAGRRLARVRLTVGDVPPIDVDLGPASLTPLGQRVPLPVDEIEALSVEILDTSPGPSASDSLEPVGLAEVGVAGLQIDEVVRPPSDLLGRAGARSAGHGLDVVLTRLGRAIGDERGADEPVLRRRIDLPVGRTFAVTGRARGMDRPGGGPTAGTCHDDLLWIDGEAVPVRVSDAADGSASFVSCAPLTIAAGSHLLEGAGSASGITVDRVVLSSSADGEPATVRPRGAVGSPAVNVTSQRSDRLDLRVASSGEAFWIVLAQSANDGWRASVDGAAVGPRQLVDGYANGWLIEPDRTGDLDVVLEWEPQHQVWWWMTASLLALLVVAAILWHSRRRRAPAELLQSEASWELPAVGCMARSTATLVALVAVGLVGLVVAPVAVAAAAVVVAAASTTRRELVWLLVVASPAGLVLGHLSQRPSLGWISVLLLLWAATATSVNEDGSTSSAREA